MGMRGWRLISIVQPARLWVAPAFFSDAARRVAKKSTKATQYSTARHRILDSTASWFITTLLGLARVARLQTGSDPVANVFTQLIQEAGRVLAVLLVKRCEGE